VNPQDEDSQEEFKGPASTEVSKGPVSPEENITKLLKELNAAIRTKTDNIAK
jgi:hypothetical protein